MKKRAHTPLSVARAKTARSAVRGLLIPALAALLFLALVPGLGRAGERPRRSLPDSIGIRIQAPAPETEPFRVAKKKTYSYQDSDQDSDRKSNRGSNRKSNRNSDLKRKWQSLSPEQKEKYRQRMKKFKELPRQDRELFQRRYRQFRELSPQDRKRLQKQLDQWDRLDPSERDKIRQRFLNQLYFPSPGGRPRIAG